MADADKRLIPYVQLHEVEALYFAEPQIMAQTFGIPSLSRRFEEIVRTCGGCESIDDSPKSAPSKRIESLFPGYTKGRSTAAHGPLIADRSSLERVRGQCPRFDGWLSRLECLANHLSA